MDLEFLCFSLSYLPHFIAACCCRDDLGEKHRDGRKEKDGKFRTLELQNPYVAWSPRCLRKDLRSAVNVGQLLDDSSRQGILFFLVDHAIEHLLRQSFMQKVEGVQREVEHDVEAVQVEKGRGRLYAFPFDIIARR